MPKQQLAISLIHGRCCGKLNVERRLKKTMTEGCLSHAERTLAAILMNHTIPSARLGDWDGIRRLARRLHELHCMPTITLPKARDVGRFGDMSPHRPSARRPGRRQRCTSAWPAKAGASVESFALEAAGGGASMRTRDALINLMLAIEADNAERPDKDWWARRRNPQPKRPNPVRPSSQSRRCWLTPAVPESGGR